MHKNLRSFLDTLKKEKDLVVIEAEVDPYLEIPEIHRRIIAEGGPALLFTNPKNSQFPIVTNLFGTKRRVKLAFGPRPEQLIQQIVKFIQQMESWKLGTLWKHREKLKEFTKIGLKSISRRKAPVLEVEEQEINLANLPVLTCWHEDGGAFLTMPLVYTEHPKTKEHNLGMYRMQIHDYNQTGMHWQIHKGGGFHHYEAEKLDEALPVTVFLGGPPALMMSAIAPLPETVPELLFTSFIMGDKLEVARLRHHAHPIIAEAEFAICGEVPAHLRKAEGPFGDHYGYYSQKHDFPVFDVKQIYRREDAIYPATIVGKPKQEDFFIGEYMSELLSPLFPLVMPGVKQLWSYGETGFHSLASAIVRESYHREAMAHAFRILGEGQLTLTKFLMVTDQPCDLKHFPHFLEVILERFNPKQDLVIIHDTSMDTLDYTGRKLNHGSKAIMLGVGEPIRALPYQYKGPDLPGIQKVKPYCGGCLLISGKSYNEDDKLAETLVKKAQTALEDWPLVFLVDDVDRIQDQTSFLWTIFTRFDPAHDLYAKTTVHRHKVEFEGPIVIDARMKPFYPDEVEPRSDIVHKVNQRWKEYFSTP